MSLGKTEDNDPVLVNLESVGLLRLGGTAADVRAVLLGLAFELANSQLSDDATVVLSGIGEELASVFPARVQHHAQLADAVSELVALTPSSAAPWTPPTSTICRRHGWPTTAATPGYPRSSCAPACRARRTPMSWPTCSPHGRAPPSP